MLSQLMIKAPKELLRVAGFTLVELMVSITIGSFLLLGLITLLVNSSHSHKQLQQAGAQIENGRYAISLLSEDIRLAGYYGEYSAPSGTIVPADPCDTTVANLGWSAVAPISVPVSINAYSTMPATCTTTATNYKSNTPVLVVRRVKTVQYTPDSAGVAPTSTSRPAGTVYLQVNQSAVTPAFVFGTSGFTLKKKNGTTMADIREYVVHLYYISTCNVCSPNDGIPTLKMVEFADNALSLVPLVDGIENMQFQYGIDYIPGSAPDGSPDCTISNPSLTNSAATPLSTEIASCPAGTWSDATTNWANVTAIRIYLLARNNDITPGYTDTKQYALGPVTTAAANDQYKRHVFTELVRVTNISGRRETP